MSAQPVTRTELDLIDEITAEGVRALLAGVRAVSRVLRKNKPMDVVQWAKENVIIPRSMSPDRAGPFKPTAPQAALMRMWQEPGARRIAIPKPPRLGITTIYTICLLYMACHEGDDVLYTERTDDAAQTSYKGILLPIIEASPNLRVLRREVKSGSRQDTWQNTYLTNGAIIQYRSVTGDGFARQIKARWMFPDESGSKEYRAGRAHSEGDKIALMERRGQQYPDSCMGMPSTPTEAGVCTVTREYLRSDQRLWDCPCPHCGTFQPLMPKVGAVGTYEGAGLKFALTEDGKVSRYRNGRGETMPDIWYECASCGDPIREEYKVEMVEAGHFRETTDPQAPGMIGGSLWAIHSTDPKSDFEHIVDDYLVSLADPSQRQPFKNLVLAQAWERTAHRTVPVSELAARRETWSTNCPQGVKLVTWGCDNQRGTDDGEKPPRGEIVFVGWGYQEESWVLGHFVVPHEPFSDAWRDEVWRLAEMQWIRPDGTKLRAAAGGVDCGYNWDQGLTFCHLEPSRKRYRIRALKGANDRNKGKTVATVGTGSPTNKTWSWLNVNKQNATEQLNERLRITTAGPGRIHIPMSLGEDVIEGLTAFRLVREKSGKTFWVKDKDGSEIYDCYVYAYARMRKLFEDNKKLQPLLLRPDDVKSGAAPVTPYVGPDRSANSALGVEAAARPAQAAAPSPAIPSSAVAPVSSTDAPEVIEIPRPQPARAPQPKRPGVPFRGPVATQPRGGFGRMW